MITISTSTMILLLLSGRLRTTHGPRGTRSSLRRVYPGMKKASEWILAQRKGGLVTCTASGTNVWGICGWRNIIDRYTLSGAVTEINAECYLALQMTSRVAQDLGLENDAQMFSEAARALRKEIHARLQSGRSGFFLLNIDSDGVAHDDVTGDLIFPVLTGLRTGIFARRFSTARRNRISGRSLVHERFRPENGILIRTRTISSGEVSGRT